MLRPLKTVTSVPGLQKLVVGMLRAIPELGSVLVVLVFVFCIFGILGVQLFAGRLHTRCRTTPFPVTLDYADAAARNATVDPLDYACLVASGQRSAADDLRAFNFDLPGDQPSWTKSTSDWSEPHACYWPLDRTTCASARTAPGRTAAATGRTGGWSTTWCGSDYDALGNARFKGTGPRAIDLDGVSDGLASERRNRTT